MAYKISWLHSQTGQASVELALLLPSLSLVLLLLLQPLCLLYTRLVMLGAAHASARVALSCVDEASCVAYAQRRLQAIPNIELFHSGGTEDWQISVSGVGQSNTTVDIQGHVKPLPLSRAVYLLMGTLDGDELLVSVRAAEQLRPSWVKGSYDEWISVWA